MDLLLQQLANGLILGSIYALVALGYTMVYGILGLINFAHGEIVMFGAMLTISLIQILGGYLPYSGLALVLTAVVVALPLTAALGLAIERLAYRPLRNAPRLAPLITAIGVSILLQNIATMIWGRAYFPFPSVLDVQRYEWHGVFFTNVHIAIIVIAFTMMGGLLVLIEKTSMGRAMRATAERPDIALLMGINPNKVIAMTFVLGSMLGAIAGVMYSANNAPSNSYMGALLGLKAFCAAVLGGIGNISGAVVGGILLGLIETLAAGYIGKVTFGFFGSQYQDVFAFIVLIAVLVFRPSGLLGERLAERA